MTAELAVPDGAAELAGLYSARGALERSRDLAEILHIHDTALAAKRYAEAKKLGAEMTGYAQEIVNRAERRIGQLLTETPPEPGRRSDLVPEGNEVATRRQQIGSRKLSARAQCLAELPEADFEKLVTKPVTRVARIARDRRAQRRRQEQAGGGAARRVTGWRRYERPVMLADRLRWMAGGVSGPKIHADSLGVIRASGWDKPWPVREPGKLDGVPGLAAAVCAEYEASRRAYERALTEAVERAAADAERIAAMIRAAEAEAPDVIVDTVRGLIAEFAP